MRIKSFLLTLIFLSLFAFQGCKKQPPRLSGVSFSKIEVTGPESSLAYDLICSRLSQEGALLSQEGAPSIAIRSYMEYDKSDGHVRSVFLVAEISGVFFDVKDNLSYGAGLHERMGNSARMLVDSIVIKSEEARSVRIENVKR